MVSSAATIWRVASIPLIPGRLMSIRTSPGRREVAVATASSPVSASPSTSKPGASVTTVLAAERNGAWSSTIRTLTELGGAPM